MKKIAIIIILLSAISGCAKVSNLPKAIRNPIHNRTGEYQQEYSLAPLKTPPGITPIKADSYYIVPEVDPSISTTVSMLPPGSALLEKENKKPVNQRQRD